MKQISIDSPFLGSRRFIRGDGTDFWDFLRQQEIPFYKKDFPFVRAVDGLSHVRAVFDWGEYLSLKSRGEALAYLYTGLGKALNYVGPVLDTELPHGFNDHTDRHTLWVAQTGVELLQRSGASYGGKSSFGPQTEVLMTLVGMMHDLGNFMDRKHHSTYSAWLMNRLFKNKKADVVAWDHAQYAILFHEEPVLLDVGVDLAHGMPLQWALVTADKMHFGRDRIGGRSFESGVEKGAFEADIHIILEALVVRSAWYLKVDTFVWHLDFSVDQLSESFEKFTKYSNRRLWVPKLFQRGYTRKGQMYRETFVKEFLIVYGNRLHMAAEGARLLFPFVHRFEVRLTDTDTRDKVGSGEVKVWEKKWGEKEEVVSEGEDQRWWMRG
jgi:hypothetical protein